MLLSRTVSMLSAVVLIGGTLDAKNLPSAVALESFKRTLRELVDQRKLASSVTIVSHAGKILIEDAYGVRDLETRQPVTADTLFLVASMTKPLTGVAMMILFDEGKWKLDDLVAKHIPQFRNLQVSEGGVTEPQGRPMTMRHLMSHTAGFDVNEASPYRTANVRDRNQPMQTMIDKLAQLSLAFQPGTDWRYGPSADIQAYLVEKISGEPFEVFLQRRIFTPLKMNHTGFWPVSGNAPGRIEVDALPLVSRMFTNGPDGFVRSMADLTDASARPLYPSGSGALISSAPDYWRFCQMMLNDGVLEGARILRPSTARLMHQNVADKGVKVAATPGLGFGLDFAILLDPKAAGSPQPPGTYFWGGGSGTWFWIDPVRDIIAVGMMHSIGANVPGARDLALRALYQ